MRVIIWALAALLVTGCSQTPPRSSALPCQLAIEGSFPVTYIDRHIPVIVVKILGQNMRLMVDTGAGGSLITNGAYNRLHLNQTYNPPRFSTIGLGGHVEIAAFALVDVTIGVVTVKDEVVGILARQLPQETGTNAIDGILGYDILQSFDIGLDLPHNRMTFYAPQHCPISQTPWQGDYAPMLFTRPQAGSPVVSETIDGSNFNVVIDTGAYRSLIMQSSLTREGVVPEHAPVTLQNTGVGIGELRFKIQNRQFSTLGIGAEVFSDARLAVDTTPQAELNEFGDGLLGEDYFASHRVFIINSTNTVYLGLSGE